MRSDASEGSPRPVEVSRHGLVPYALALEMQKARQALREKDLCCDCLFLMEHPPVLTLGLRGKTSHVLAPPETLGRLGVEVFRTDRGGDVTFHGPGQLVGYPVLHLGRRRLAAGDYARLLEKAIIDGLTPFGLSGECLPGFPGVWVKGCKIAAIGVMVSGGGVSRHGFALNVNTDLRFFDLIIPCGLTGRRVTSMERELGFPAPFEDVARSVEKSFLAVFQGGLLTKG